MSRFMRENLTGFLFTALLDLIILLQLRISHGCTDRRFGSRPFPCSLKRRLVVGGVGAHRARCWSSSPRVLIAHKIHRVKHCWSASISPVATAVIV